MPMEMDFSRKLSRGLGVSLNGLVTLLAIAAVLVTVSVPRLRGFALQANERDALATSRLLARALQRVELGPDASIRQLVEEAQLGRLLDDAEYLQAGSLLRRHGYLFRLTQAPPPLHLTGSGRTVLAGEAPDPACVILAWPWDSGRTGGSALAVFPAGPALGCANEGGRWSGPELGSLLDRGRGWDDWRPIP